MIEPSELTEEEILIVCRKLEEIAIELQELSEKIFLRMMLKEDIRITLTEAKPF